MFKADVSSDPRFNNVLMSGSLVKEYIENYQDVLRSVLANIPSEVLETALSFLKNAVLARNTVYVAGNGGSAAIAEHLSCDWMKGTRGSDGRVLRVQSLVSNVALCTAISNDYGYEKVFSTQLEMLAKPGDVLVLISSSGNSPNIRMALKKANELGIKVIGMSGFSGGALREMSDVSIHVDFSNYGIVEDAHQIIMHGLAQCLVKHFESN